MPMRSELQADRQCQGNIGSSIRKKARRRGERCREEEDLHTSKVADIRGTHVCQLAS